MTEESSATAKTLVVIVVIAILIAIGVWWYYTHMRHPGQAQHATTAASAPAVASTAPPPIAHPISQAQTGPAPASTAPLPPLMGSGAAAAKALAGIPGADKLGHLLLARGLIPHIVATIDALPRHEIGVNILPLRTPEGIFTVKKADGQMVIAAGDYTRYAPYMGIVEAVSAQSMVAFYVHWYPLFQQAYQKLGYPHGYFNDRLLVAINDLLAAPDPQPPVALVMTPDGHYDFANPQWEALSVGQKLMIRVGPDNERILKRKLRHIRALLVGKTAELRNRASAPLPQH